MKRVFGPEILLLLALLIVLDGVTFYDLVKAQGISNNLYVSHEVIMTSRDIHRCVTQAETGQRGYLLTGRDIYLDHYYTAVTDLEEMVLRLESSCVKETPEVSAIRKSATIKMAEMTETISLYRKAGPEAALRVVNTDRGKHAMECISKNVIVIRKNEEKIAEDLYSSLVYVLKMLSIIRGGHTLLAVVLIGLLVSNYRRNSNVGAG